MLFKDGKSYLVLNCFSMAKKEEELIVEGRKIKFDNGYMSLTDIALLKVC